MTSQTFGKIQYRRGQIEKELGELDAGIAQAILDEADDRELSKLRTRRRNLIDEADDLGEALRGLEQRAEDYLEKERKGEQTKALNDARSAADSFVANAKEVDEALLTLEQAFDKLKLSEIDLSRALRLAGRSARGHLVNGIGPALRWASWLTAQGFSEMAQVPRVPAQRRRSMAESAKRLVPSITEG